MTKFWKLPALATILTMAAAPAFAQEGGSAEERMKTIKPASEVQGEQIGELKCEIAGGWGMILGSAKDVTCSFKHKNGTVEKYAGKMTKLGIDIGKTEKSYMSWVVFTTAENKPGEYALAGDYVGVSTGASLGIGLGANALVGGSKKQIGLQPISVEGMQGVNLALALASLKLEPAK